ncbi:MAG TPA: ATP-grasp domain-containing protein [Candidatus Tectomicrobia bacterium]|nr:ATP-grasp domain-containing protein [Candidatus Tectomicrobia bacterium]
MTVPVLVTDAPSNANLAVVRSLGRRGIPVGVCGFPEEFNLSFHSRYAAARHVLPSPTRDPSGFLLGLRDTLKAGRYPILLPTTERTLQLISEHRDALPGSVALPIASHDAIETALDKRRTIALAERLGVPVPATWSPDTAAEAASLAPTLPYPVIVKPRQTNVRGGDGRLRTAAFRIAESPAALALAWETVDAVAPRPLVQCVVPGQGAGIFALCDRGRPLVWFAHRRLREEDPRGGRAVAAESVAPDARMVEAAEALIRALDWHGVVMVEFRRDADRDAFWLLEINGRFWGSLALALAAGVDFPYYLYQLARGEEVRAPATYRTHVVARDAVGELKHFARVMRGVTSPAGRTTSRWALARQAATVLHPWKASYNWVADDPRPGRAEYVRFLARLVGAR